MLESFESQFISGKLPDSLRSKFYHIRKHHDFIDFYDSKFIIAHNNNLYRFGGEHVHLTTANKEFVPVEWSIEVLNPLTQEFMSVDTERSEFHSRNRKMEINSYTHGYQEYLKVDYDHYSHWLWFDMNSYIQDKYSKEVTVSYDDYNQLLLDLYGTPKKLKCIKEYGKNIDIDYSKPKATGHVIGFQEAQEFYSFIRELNEELSTINFGDKFSELYDAVVKGEVSKEDFLKAVI